MFRSFFSDEEYLYLVAASTELQSNEAQIVSWLINASIITDKKDQLGPFIGPRASMVSPWSTNSVEVGKSVGLTSLERIERFAKSNSTSFNHDPMTEVVYEKISLELFEENLSPQKTRFIKNLDEYNKAQGLALSKDELSFLEEFSKKEGRDLTDAEVFGFGQINSEHCRHKIFNGKFVIDSKEKEETLFSLIKKTSKGEAAKRIVSAYSDNVAFMKGPETEIFSSEILDKSNDVHRTYKIRKTETAVSLKAETHNFPTIVEPFSGAATGSGGEIRDRMAGGKGSLPLVGTAVYMTSYPRFEQSKKKWEEAFPEREWKFQSPQDILIKASNGASDFGNKFGQPLITGSLLTFEAQTNLSDYAYDRAVMLAGGVGYTPLESALKDDPKTGDLILVLGGDNYRIGMAGSSVSSVDSGVLDQSLELSAVQRSNPEMQKRVYNVIRAIVESGENIIRLIHDHGAGGHMNCLAELVEKTGGKINLDSLPIGDKSLSAKELLSNESQERMGLVVPKESLEKIKVIAEREKAPLFVVGEVIDNQRLVFSSKSPETYGLDGHDAVDLPLEILFGKTPKCILKGETLEPELKEFNPEIKSEIELVQKIKEVLSLEAVACKDWLTNKVDRSVTGLVANQQCAGALQLPVNDLGVVKFSYASDKGIATSIGHAPQAALISPEAGSRLSVAESLTNLIWAPLENGLETIALSANWMWPAKRPGENSRLYRAVEALSDFAIELGLPVPTGKDSLSMTMNYPDGKEVRAPGTVVVSASATCEDVSKIVTADIKDSSEDTALVYLNLSGQKEFHLGASSLAQTHSQLGDKSPDVKSSKKFLEGFLFIQSLIKEEKILAGHDVSAGGVITALLEMAFAGKKGLKISLKKSFKFLFSEKPAVVFQVNSSDLDQILKTAEENNLDCFKLGEPINEESLELTINKFSFIGSMKNFFDSWYETSHNFELLQVPKDIAASRKDNIWKSKLSYEIPKNVNEKLISFVKELNNSSPKPIAAVLRDKGTNGEREMAYSLYAAGFSVKDITMKELCSGKESLTDVSFLTFPGGFTNSDVLGAARGWAGSFLFNETAKKSLANFLNRDNTLSLGVCNGCQLMALLGIITEKELNDNSDIKLLDNHSKKFESCFLNLTVPKTNSVLLKPLIGSRLGAWVAHGEGRFEFSKPIENYDIALEYSSSNYPQNPNGSEHNSAGVVSKDGRHLAMMPHIERSIMPVQWPYLLNGTLEKDSKFSPWILAFNAAREWVVEKK